MAELKLIDVSALPVETQKFEGASLPYVAETPEGSEFKRMDLSAYDAHVRDEARKQNEADAGLVLRFAGVMDMVGLLLPGPISDPAAQIYYSIDDMAFVFMLDGSYYAGHTIYGPMYNKGNFAADDKLFLCNADDELYAFSMDEGRFKKLTSVTELAKEHMTMPFDGFVNVVMEQTSSTLLENPHVYFNTWNNKFVFESNDTGYTTDAPHFLKEEYYKADGADRTPKNEKIYLYHSRLYTMVGGHGLQLVTDVEDATGGNPHKPMSQKATTEALDLKVDKTAIVQETGTSTTDVMSQSAVSSRLKEVMDRTIRNTQDLIRVESNQKTGDEGLSQRIDNLDTAYKAADAALRTDIDACQAKVDEIMLGTSDHIAAAWDGTTNERAVAEAGDKDLIDWKPFLLDKTDNDGEFTTPVGVLQRNNYLRFEDGTFAPTVGITAEMAAECDGELYRKEGGQLVKVCDAGMFDAAAFYEQYGINEKLYDINGVEKRVLRPWETTETKYSIGIGYDRDLYMIDNAEGTSGKIWKEISTQPHQWDGINPVKLAPTAISPSGVYCIEENGLMKTRCFFNLYEGLDKGSVHSAGYEGSGGCCMIFKDGRTYPTVSGITQARNMEWARNNNADPKKSYPFAEGGFLYRDMFIAYQEMKYGRKDLNNINFFSSGISSYGDCSSEATWLANGGVRHKLPNGEWVYLRMWSTPDGIYKDASGKQGTWTSLLNQQAAKEQCMESQLAASWAVEMGIPENQQFEMYGSTYYWQNVPGTNGLLDGKMNVIVHKIARSVMDAYDAAGAPLKVDVEANLRMSLTDGMTLSGDIFCYWGGGYEMVGEVLPTSTSGGSGEPLDIYLEPDQKKWHSETGTSKLNKGKFKFEKTYVHMAHTTAASGYALRTFPFTNYPMVRGGGLYKGDCYYTYNSNYWGSTVDSRVRIGFRPRGNASNDICSARLANCYSSVAATATTFGGSEQSLLQPAVANKAQP